VWCRKWGIPLLHPKITHSLVSSKRKWILPQHRIKNPLLRPRYSTLSLNVCHFFQRIKQGRAINEISSPAACWPRGRSTHASKSQHAQAALPNSSNFSSALIAARERVDGLGDEIPHEMEVGTAGEVEEVNLREELPLRSLACLRRPRLSRGVVAFSFDRSVASRDGSYLHHPVS
jgi:hypothetical protein